MRNSKLLLNIVCIVIMANADILAQDAENVEQVGRTLNYWDIAQGVYIQGDFAYLATGLSGLQIVDISNLNNLEIVGFYDELPADVFVRDDIAYLSIYDHNEVPGEGLWLIDISDPTSPQPKDHDTDIFGAKSIELSGDYAYAASENIGMRVINISDPDSIFQVGIYNTSGRVIGLDLTDNIAYVTVNDSREPYGENNRLEILDISDLENINEMGRIEVNCIDVKVRDNFAYVMARGANLSVILVSNPEEPRLIGETDIEDADIGGFDIFDDHAYLGGEQGLHVVDIYDPQNPHEVALYESWQFSWDVKIVGEYAYSAGRDSGLVVLVRRQN